MKYWIRFSLICLATAYIFLGLIAYFLFWPTQTLTIIGYDETHPIPIENPLVRPGEALVYKLNYCKYTATPSVVHRTFIDGQVIILTDTPGALPVGCHVVTVKTAVVPATINPGRYYLDVQVVYKINPFRNEYIHYRTAYFNVQGEDVSGEATSTENLIINK